MCGCPIPWSGLFGNKVLTYILSSCLIHPPCTPQLALLSMLSGSIAKAKKGLIYFFLTAAQMINPRHCKTSCTPQWKEWIKKKLIILCLWRNILHAFRTDTMSFQKFGPPGFCLQEIIFSWMYAPHLFATLPFLGLTNVWAFLAFLGVQAVPSVIYHFLPISPSLLPFTPPSFSNVPC